MRDLLARKEHMLLLDKYTSGEVTISDFNNPALARQVARFINALGESGVEGARAAAEEVYDTMPALGKGKAVQADPGSKPPPGFKA